MRAKKLWVEAHRPKFISDYVFKDQKQKEQIMQWVADKSIPHLLFSGSAGLGKTTLAKVLCNELEIDPSDILTINGSSQNGVDFIRDTITGFVSVMPFGTFKVVLIDEGDYLSPSSQAALRNLMETYSSTARFIITCNYPQRIIPALHSRCQGFHIEKLDRAGFEERVAQILITEGVEFDIDTLDAFVATTYPDMRKCINTLQLNSINGVLKMPEKDDYTSSDYRLQAIALFRDRKFKEARKLICEQAKSEEYEELFTFMYQNLDIWCENDDSKEGEAIVVIRNGMAKHPLCADQEINVSATLVELEMIARK